MCSIAYEPCDERSFRIGPKRIRQPDYPISPYSTYNGGVGGYPYQPNPYQANPYYGNPAFNNPIIGPNGMLIPNPYVSNGVVPNRIVYDANGVPSVIAPNGMLYPANSNALTGLFDELFYFDNFIEFSFLFAAQMAGIPLQVTNGAGGGGGGGGGPVQYDQLQNANAINGTSPNNNGTMTSTNTTTTTTTTTTTPAYDEIEGSGDEDEDDDDDINNTPNREKLGKSVAFNLFLLFY